LKLQLPDVTLLCIDTDNHALAYHAIIASMSRADFGRAVWMTDIGYEDMPPMMGVELIQIPRITSLRDYSIMMMRELWRIVKTSHVLIIQWDGYVVYPDAWNPEWLKYDYIGAPWYWKEKNQVGNGGFSLRSKKLLNAVKDGAFVVHGNEDVLICEVYKKQLQKKYKIQYAPVEVAKHFAYEGDFPGYPTFGFHGIFNFPEVMSEKKLLQIIPHIRDNKVNDVIFDSLYGNCKRMKMLDAAEALVQKHKIYNMGKLRDKNAG